MNDRMRTDFASDDQKKLCMEAAFWRLEWGMAPLAQRGVRTQSERRGIGGTLRNSKGVAGAQRLQHGWPVVLLQLPSYAGRPRGLERLFGQ